MDADSGHISISNPEVRLWASSKFAKAWYVDARESVAYVDRNARRREIVFSVCCVENYLVEWVRDDIVKPHFQELVTYFPEKERDGIRERWKRVVKHLRKDGKTPACQDFNSVTWSDFCRLVEFRNGLVHGRPSRPAEASQKPGLQPLPTPAELDSLEGGWAVEVVRNLITDLHNTVGTTPPVWLARH